MNNLLLKQDMYEVNFATIGGNDILSSKLTIDQIIEYGPDFGFIQLDEIDHIGHVNGFGKQYSEKSMDNGLKKMCDLGMIDIYGKETRYIQLNNWNGFQRIDHKKPSRFPSRKDYEEKGE